MRAKVVLVLLFSLLGGLLLVARGSLAQDSAEIRPFPETGHTVEGEFLHFFEDHGELLVLGYPITPSFYYQKEQRQVQYFQNGRLEIDPVDGQVRLSPLPVKFILEKRTLPISKDEVPPGGMLFEPTGHSVVLAFLDFYLQHGGPRIFGYPIAELTEEDSRPVQYFERAVFEWRPELPNGQRVQLARLGEAHFQIARHDPNLLNPIARVMTITGIDVSAAVRSPVVSQQDGEQQVFVYVSDQVGQPVVGAHVEATVLLPKNRQSQSATLTDQNGTAVFGLSVSSLPAGETIPIQIKAAYQQHWNDTATAFRIWW